MNIDKFKGVGLLVVIVVAIFMFLIWAIGFGSVTRPMISEGAASVGNYTDNVTAYEGFTQSFTAAPLLIGLLFVGFLVFAVWQIVRRMVKGNEGR